jgi:trk system potassium uptake protein TrkH
LDQDEFCPGFVDWISNPDRCGSISAFNNAGFDIMGEFRSVTEYAGGFTVIMTLSALFIIGCIGYIALLDIKRNRSLKKLSVHT